MMPETRFQELKRYVRFQDSDALLLVAFLERARPEFPRIAREFYDRIREHAAAHDVFTGEEQIERLQRSLIAWMTRLCSGTYDEKYHAQTAQIGRVHVKIGLPQRYMLTAMALIRVSLLRIADRVLGEEEAAPTREALIRLLDLELAIMLESYKDDYVERIRAVERLERADLDVALARAERRYVNAVELAGVMIVGLDSSGLVLLFNREAERITGFARDEVFGRAFLSVLGHDGSSDRQLPNRLQEALNGHAMQQVVEAVLRTRSGKLRTVVWSLGFAGTDPGTMLPCSRSAAT